MVYDVNDDPLQTGELVTCVVASRLWCHVVLVACNNKFAHLSANPINASAQGMHMKYIQ